MIFRVIWQTFLMAVITVLCVTMIKIGHTYWWFVMVFDWLVYGMAIYYINEEYQLIQALKQLNIIR